MSKCHFNLIKDNTIHLNSSDVECMENFMSLRSLAYSEYEGGPRQWVMTRTEFGEINLLVGKNSTGKSRILNVLASACR